jgi:hypothetical protein
MNIPGDLKVTTEILYKGALIFALIDIFYVIILFRLVKTGELVKLKWSLVTVIAIFFCFLLGFIMSVLFWDSVYSYVFPVWARWIIPPCYGLLFSVAGLLFWWIAVRFQRISVLVFCLLGGTWGVLTHILAIERGILDKPPMLQGSSPAAALTIAAFEFIFYWCVCLSLAKFVQILRAKNS